MVRPRGHTRGFFRFGGVVGFSSLGKCYGTQQAAAQAECASYPRTVASSDGVVSYSCLAPGASGDALSLLRADSTGASASVSVPVSFSSCDEMAPYNDATTMFWLGMTAIAGVYCARAFVLRLIEDH